MLNLEERDIEERDDLCRRRRARGRIGLCVAAGIKKQQRRSENQEKTNCQSFTVHERPHLVSGSVRLNHDGARVIRTA